MSGIDWPSIAIGGIGALLLYAIGAIMVSGFRQWFQHGPDLSLEDLIYEVDPAPTAFSEQPPIPGPHEWVKDELRSMSDNELNELVDSARQPPRYPHQMIDAGMPLTPAMKKKVRDELAERPPHLPEQS